MGSRIRVLLVDDHPMVLEGIEAMLSNYIDIEVVAQAHSGSQALQYAEKLAPDVVLLDIRMPGSNGIQVARLLKKMSKEIKVIMLTTYEEDEYLFGALEAGADGYLLKTVPSEELSDAIRDVNCGGRLLSLGLVGKLVKQFENVAKEKVRLECGLTLQELKLLELVADGATNTEIADRLYWSEITVKRKLQDILRKLEVSNRTQAVVQAMRRGLI